MMRTALAILAGLSLTAAEHTVPSLPPRDGTSADVPELSHSRSLLVRSLAKSPAVIAAQERLAAAHQASGAAGRLPDPMLGTGYARKSASGERWPVYDVTLEQPLPRWGERDAARAKALAESAVTEADLHDVVGEIAAEVATTLAEADAARAKLAVVEGQITRTNAIKSIIAARLAAGTGSIGDQLGVQSQLASLQVERETMQRLVLDAEQDARGRLGLAPGQDLPPFAAPDQATISTERAPGMLAAKAKTAEADAMFQEARASRYPETSVGVRFEQEQQPGDAMTSMGLEVRVSLPVWQASSDQLESAALARRRAARHDLAGWEFRVKSMVGRAERATTVARSARQAAQETKIRLDAEYDSLLGSVGTASGTTMMSILEVLDRLCEAERTVIEAETAARQAQASLWRLAPPDFSTMSSEGKLP